MKIRREKGVTRYFFWSLSDLWPSKHRSCAYEDKHNNPTPRDERRATLKSEETNLTNSPRATTNDSWRFLSFSFGQRFCLHCWRWRVKHFHSLPVDPSTRFDRHRAKDSDWRFDVDRRNTIEERHFLNSKQRTKSKRDEKNNELFDCIQSEVEMVRLPLTFFHFASNQPEGEKMHFRTKSNRSYSIGFSRFFNVMRRDDDRRSTRFRNRNQMTPDSEWIDQEEKHREKGERERETNFSRRRGSTPTVGSSRINNWGCWRRAQANDTRRCWPPLKTKASNLKKRERTNLSWEIRFDREGKSRKERRNCSRERISLRSMWWRWPK